MRTALAAAVKDTRAKAAPLRPVSAYNALESSMRVCGRKTAV